MELLLGHLVGDYLLQNNWMAMNKSGSTFKCLIHCLIYTVAVCLICWIPDWRWFVIVFLSHYFIDRYSLADKWLKLIKGRSLTEFLNADNSSKQLTSDFFNHIILRGGFTSLVYCVADNTMHLLIMYYGMKFIKGC